MDETIALTKEYGNYAAGGDAIARGAEQTVNDFLAAHNAVSYTHLQSMGLLDPLPVQIGRFWVNMLHGDLGVSHIYKVNASVTSILAKKLPISIQMGCLLYTSRCV